MLGNGFSQTFDPVLSGQGKAVFGLGNEQSAEEINKALSIGYSYPPTTGADALRMESLETTMHVVTYGLKNIKIWPDLPKKQAFSTVESYDLLTSYGDQSGIFTNGGELPQVQDSGYVRKTQNIKFCGVSGEVAHHSTLVNTPYGDLVALETQNKTVSLVMGIEQAIFHGRSDIVGQEWDGLAKQFMDGAYTNGATFDPWNNDPVQPGFSVVIDLRGGSLTEDIVEFAANQVVEQYGESTDLYCAPRASSELNKQMYPRERINLPAPNNGKVGVSVRTIETGAGDITINKDVFLRPGHANAGTNRSNPPTVATNVNAPLAPTIAVAAAADSSNLSKFAAGDAATYVYQVAALNRFGQSAASATASVAVAATQKVTVTITDGGGANPATGYVIYRSINGAPASLGPQILTRIPRVTLAGSGVFVDYNFYLPATSRAYMVTKDEGFFAFRQLCPMVKVPLATVAISIRWAQVMYGALFCYQPQRGIMFLNVKDR